MQTSSKALPAMLQHTAPTIQYSLRRRSVITLSLTDEVFYFPFAIANPLFRRFLDAPPPSCTLR
jgi:hypothetical protein